MRSKLEILIRRTSIKTEIKVLEEKAAALKISGPGSVARRTERNEMWKKIAELEVEKSALEWVLNGDYA